MAPAALDVIVHHPHRLHEGVGGSRAEEAEAAPLQIFREALARGRLGHRAERLGGEPGGALLLRRNEPPDVLREGALGLDHAQRHAGVVDRRLDLPAMTDDAGVPQQAGHVLLPEAGHLLRVEAGEHLTEAIALLEDGQPGEPGLKAFEHELLIEAVIVLHRATPLIVVVAEIERIGPRPETTSDAARVRDEA